jgi:hypothetical protein
LAIIALPLATLTLISVDVALKTALIAAAAGTSTALLNFWHPMPGNRRGMLRRHSQSKMIALLEHGIAMLWAIAIILTLIGTVLAAVPMVLVIGILISFKQRCAQAAASSPSAANCQLHQPLALACNPTEDVSPSTGAERD